jgi:Spy/CpxP family protein refolding chaperone
MEMREGNSFMEIRRNLTWQVRVLALVIFLLGFIAGGLSFNAYNVWFGSRKSMSKEEKYRQILDKLDLSEQQRAEVEKIISETREEIQALRRETEPKIREIRNRTSEKMQKVLTQQQWEKFQQLHEQAFSRKN